ncbi:MAG: MFS transporter [Kiritimatiellae bacterium]|nr:MFS transporter [Kiritimatiellia bacterium]
MVLLYMLSFFQRTAIPGTVFNEIQSECRLTASAVAALGTIFVLVYGSMQIAVGFVVDRFGGGKSILFGGGVMAAGSLLFPLCHEAGLLFATRAFTGLGACFMYLCILKETSVRFPPRLFTVLLGGAIFCGMLGGMLGTWPMQQLAAAIGWRQALFGVGVLTVLATLAAWLSLRRLPERLTRPTPVAWRYLREVLTNRRALPLLVSGLWGYPVYFVVQTTVGKKFLEDFAGLTAGRAAGFTLLMAVTGAVSVLFSGWAVNRFGQRRKPWLMISGAGLLVASVMLLCGTLAPAPGWIFLCAYVFLSLINIASPVQAALMRELHRARVLALSVASFNGLCYIGAGLMTSAAGAIMDAYRSQAVSSAAGLHYPREAYAWIFACLLASSTICTALYVLTPETRGRTLEERFRIDQDASRS